MRVAALELRIQSDRRERGVIAAVVAGQCGVDAVLGEQLRRHANVRRGEPQLVAASLANLHGAADLVTGAAEQAIRLGHLALANQRADARARDPFASVGYVLDGHAPDAARREVLAHHRDVALALVAESKRRSDDGIAHAQTLGENFEKRFRLQRCHRVVELHEETFFESRLGKEREALLRRADAAAAPSPGADAWTDGSRTSARPNASRACASEASAARSPDGRDGIHRRSRSRARAAGRPRARARA